MEDSAEGCGAAKLCGCIGELLLGVGSDADEKLGLEDFEHGAKVLVAGLGHRSHGSVSYTHLTLPTKA